MYAFMLVSRFFSMMIFGFGSGYWDWKTKDLERKVLRRSTFAEVGLLMVPVAFFMILSVLGINFHHLCCPGDWLEIG